MTDTPPSRTRRTAAAGAWIAAALALVVVAGGGAFWLATHLGRHESTSEVPDLVGLGADEAAVAARRAGVVLEVVDERNDPSVPSGAVLAQDPAAGSRVRGGRKVRVVRSLGAARLDVPVLVGAPAREAEFRIRQQGLAPGDESRAFARGAPAGTVIAQTPASGTIAGSDTRVHRLVSDGPVPPRWVMPDLTGLALARVDSWIETCGFRRGAVRRVPSDAGPAGTVVGQLPPSGHPIPARGIVELTVAQ